MRPAPLPYRPHFREHKAAARKPSGYLVCRRPLPLEAGVVIAVGDVLPAERAWPRIESWVRAGRLEPIF